MPEVKTNPDRTRIIIFATDNDVSGEEAVTLEDACSICKKYGINLYAYCPSVEMNKNTSKDKIEAYRNAVENNANGKFYTGDLDKMTSNIVNEIKETKTTLLKTGKKTLKIEQPKIFFICVLILFLIVIILEKRIRL